MHYSLSTALFAYPILKYLSYAAWCGLLSRAYNPERRLWRTAWGLGIVRLFIGIIVGAILTYSGIQIEFGTHYVFTWVALMLPVRWLEWSVMALILAKSGFDPAKFLLGVNGKLRAWQLGGIVVSFATDFLMMMAAGSIRAMIC